MLSAFKTATRLLLLGAPQAQEESRDQTYAPLIQDLKQWIYADPTRLAAFETAIRTARSHNTPEMRDIPTLEAYLAFTNSNLTWIPTEAVRPRDLLTRLTAMWFVLDQPSVLGYQNAVAPVFGSTTHPHPEKHLTWLSGWMRRYSAAIGEFMDTPVSASELHTFHQTLSYNLRDYIEPRGGWRTFNEFFARRVKPGRRPITAIGDNSVLTSPADFEFMDSHRVSPESTISTKGLTWALAQMFENSVYGDRFAGGVWMHGFLDVDDYHRVHAPVAGVVVEARIVPGTNYMLVEAAPSLGEDGVGELCIPNETGYQFCQSRGLVILDTGGGLVAVLPVGMAVVSSVVLTVEVGAVLHKGEEIGYFQFGGSDVVLVFEEAMDVEISMERGRHYRMGREIGRANGVCRTEVLR
ncbi:phosphatidylserine decarboxylase-domain-containing protein [Aspergillus heterothallicus]